MNPANRTQADGKNELYSELTGLDFDPSLDKARQEFKQESDVNIILARFGVNAPQKQATFGEVDYNIDLQTAFAAIADAKRAHRELPEEIRRDYPTWQSLLNGIESGEIRFKDQPPAEPAAEATT